MKGTNPLESHFVLSVEEISKTKQNKQTKQNKKEQKIKPKQNKLEIEDFALNCTVEVILVA